MNRPSNTTNPDQSVISEHSIARRDFLGTLGMGSLAAALTGGWNQHAQAMDLEENRQP